MNEDELIAGLNNGNEDVFHHLYDLFYPRLCYYASNLLPESQNVEDIVQDAFISLWQRKEKFSNLRSLKSFLYVVVKNKCFNTSKHLKIARDVQYELSINNEGNESDVFVIESEVIESLYMAISKLPKGCRKILSLSYFSQLKNREIADLLDVSVNTVKTQKRRGITLLRSILGHPAIRLVVTYFS